MTYSRFTEEFQVRGRDLVQKISEILHEGNVTRIVVKDKNGETFIQIPATLGIFGIVLAPIITTVGALSALVANFVIVVERAQPKATKTKWSPLNKRSIR